LIISIFRVHAGCTGSFTWVSSYQKVRGSPSGSSAASALDRHVPSADKLSVIRNLGDQLKHVQQELKEMTTTTAVSQLRSATIEHYLLDKMNSLTKALNCEYLSDPPSLRVLRVSMLIFFFDCAGICSDPRAESSHVTTCLNAACLHDNVVAETFWPDRTNPIH
jgi:hypothetical protein